jgi:RHS repeat-associated protein
VPSYLHRDHLGSVRAITDTTGARVEAATYKPFGEQTEFVQPGLPAPESKGWIGERYDADAGLQYLNARYYDPVLGMFLQPDWFEVLKPGVGTNRFSYSFNDPVNRLDPMGNQDAPSITSEEEDEEYRDKCRNGCNTGRTYLQDMSDVLEAGAMMTGAVAYELSPAGAVNNIYNGLRAGNYGQAALGVVEIVPWGKAAGKLFGTATRVTPAPVRTLDELSGRGIAVVGTPQFTRGAGGMDHAMASVKAAIDEVNAIGPENVSTVYFDTSLGKIVDGVSSRMRPDTAISTRAGSVHLIEVASPSQTVGQMFSKISNMGTMIMSTNSSINVSGWSRTVADILSR